MFQKKSWKKVIFIFANFFFKIHFGHFFMSNFKIKKKVLKTPSFSIFRPFFKFKNYYLCPENRYFIFFFVEFAFSGELFVNLHFLSWFILFYMIFMTFLSFFILLMKKNIIIKYFFIINVPINYPPLSKKCAKLSKNCPFTSKK